MNAKLEISGGSLLLLMLKTTLDGLMIYTGKESVILKL